MRDLKFYITALIATMVFLSLPSKINSQFREKTNIFISSNSNGVAYDKLKTKEQRDSMVYECLMQDWVDTMRYNPPPYEWVCANYSSQLTVNFHGWTSNEIYNGYDGFNLDSIYMNSGTLKDNGKYGLPVLSVSLGVDNATNGHAMNAILTGDDALNWNDWNFIEPQFDQMNVQPGQAYMPGIFWGTDTANGTIYVNCPLGGPVGVGFRIENGEPELVVNPDIDDGIPNPLLILKRDTVNPIIKTGSPISNLLYNYDPDFEYEIQDSTLKYAWYSFDNGKTKDTLFRDLYEYKVIGQEYCGPPQCTVGYWYEKYAWVPTDTACRDIKFSLEDGDYNLTISAIDYFNLETTNTIKFSIDKTSPIINVSSPNQGSTYSQDEVEFSYVINEKNIDLSNSFYVLNGVTNYLFDTAGTISLNSKEGLNTLEIHIQDLATNKSNRTLTYTINNQTTGINNIKNSPIVLFYPNPVTDIGVFEFQKKDNKPYYLEIYSTNGSLLSKTICLNDVVTIDFSQYPSGILTYKVMDSYMTLGIGTIINQ